jgi:hypothetical protein
MKTTHIGKIGRLSRRLRNQLGARLEDGQDGQTILDWLNGETEAKRSFQLYFERRPIGGVLGFGGFGAGNQHIVDNQQVMKIDGGLVNPCEGYDNEWQQLFINHKGTEAESMIDGVR